MLLNVALLSWLFSTTEYVIAGADLVVRSGPIRFTIPIQSIRRVRPPRSFMSAPALSLDRLEISYGTYGSVVLSPSDKRAFVDALRVRAPNVDVDASIL